MRRRLKYRNIPVTIDGRRFASRREGRRYLALKLLERAGEIDGLRCQVPYVLEVNGAKLGKYVADFVYSDKRDRVVVEDVKGIRTPIYKLKAKLMLACHGIKILET